MKELSRAGMLKRFINDNGVNYKSISLLFALILVHFKLFEVARFYFKAFCMRGYNIKLLRLCFQFAFHHIWDLDLAIKACNKMLQNASEMNQYDKFYTILLGGMRNNVELLEKIMGMFDSNTSLYYYAKATLECVNNQNDYIYTYTKCYDIGVTEHRGSIPEWVEHSANFITDMNVNFDRLENNIKKYNLNRGGEKQDDYFILISADPEYFYIYVDRITSRLRRYGNDQKIYFLLASNSEINDKILTKIEECERQYSNVQVVIENFDEKNVGLRSSLIRYTLLQKYLNIEKRAALILDIDLYVDIDFGDLYQEFLSSNSDVAFWDTKSSLPWSRYIAAIAFLPYSLTAIKFLSLYEQYVDTVYNNGHPRWTLDQNAIYHAFEIYNDIYHTTIANYNIGDHQKRMSVKLSKNSDGHVERKKQEIKMKYVNRLVDM